jgi:hypothetical protein
VLNGEKTDNEQIGEALAPDAGSFEKVYAQMTKGAGNQLSDV